MSETRICARCGEELPKRAKSRTKDQIPFMGQMLDAVVRLFVCKHCGYRHAMVEARY